jgi:hypothetical protein
MSIVSNDNLAAAAISSLFGTTSRDVSVDSFGTVYVSEYSNSRVTKWPKGATNETLVAGTGTAGAGSTQLDSPSVIRFDMNGDLYVTDYANNRIQRFTINNTSC